MLRQKGISIGNRQALVRRTTNGPVPLSYAQQRLWFLNQLDPDSYSYNVPLRLRLWGRLEVSALSEALDEVVRRHEILRTTFTVIDGQPMQMVAPAQPLPLPVFELHELTKRDRDAAVMRIMLEEGRHVFDLSREFSVRACLIRLGTEQHIVLLTMHHIISDGWSTSVLIRELESLYQAFLARETSPLVELPIQYADYAVWQRKNLRGEVIAEQLAYWKAHLAGAPSVLELPTDKPRPPSQSSRGARESFDLPISLIEQLKALSEQQEVTLFMMLVAIFQVLLVRYTGQEQISIGSPIAGRDQLETENLIGLFAYTLVLYTDLRGDPSFPELLKRVREVAIGAFAHQDVPFEKLVEELQPQRSLSHAPLFQVMLILQNVPQKKIDLKGLRVEQVNVEGETANFDLTLSIVESDKGLKGAFEYNADLFEAETVQRMIGHLKQLMASVVHEPQQPISRLPLLTEAERQQFVEWNHTEQDFARQCLHQTLEMQAEHTPESVALTFGNDHLSYTDLDQRSNQLARHLTGLGVCAEVRVGILMQRSVDMVVALLAVLKAGGAYVPLDPQYPPERLKWMLEDSGITVLLTDPESVAALATSGPRVVCIADERAVIARHSRQRLNLDVSAGSLAYVIYTSGSSGRPKGVAITHCSAVMFVHWAQSVFSVDDLTGVLASTSICFDLSIFELFVPLSCGGRVVLADNALALPELPAAREVKLINTVPSAFAEMLRGGNVPDTVRIVNLAGEALSHKLARDSYRQEQIVALYNLYGPTEDTTYSTYILVPRGGDESPTIGRPIANTQAYVLDRHLQPVPIGLVGELYLGGAGLARGYLNRPDLTAERFIPNPFGDETGSRLYKTGDLVRFRSNGELEYISRSDLQVKIRGFRIELSEIEAALTQHPAVKNVAVMAREDEVGKKRLVAYVATDRDPTPGVDELGAYLRKQLPEYMVPSAFVLLAELPQTPNGKVDRRALPVPSAARPDLVKEYVSPRTELELRMAEIWQEVLGTERVGVHDNFFDLGGHSLLASQVVAGLRERLGINIPLRVMFETPTVEGLALMAHSIQGHHGVNGRFSTTREIAKP